MGTSNKDINDTTGNLDKEFIIWQEVYCDTELMRKGYISFQLDLEKLRKQEATHRLRELLASL